MQKVDTELILAFINGSLDKETEQQVRLLINTYSEWFIEYIDLKQAVESAESFNGSVFDNESKDEDIFLKRPFKFPLFPSNNGSFINTLSLSNFSYLAIFALISFTFLFLIFTQNPSKSYYRSQSQFTSIELQDGSINVESIYPEVLTVSVTIPSIVKDPDFNYLDFNSYLILIEEGDQLSIKLSDVQKFYNIDLDENERIKVIIYNSSREKIHEEIF